MTVLWADIKKQKLKVPDLEARFPKGTEMENQDLQNVLPSSIFPPEQGLLICNFTPMSTPCQKEKEAKYKWKYLLCLYSLGEEELVLSAVPGEVGTTHPSPPAGLQKSQDHVGVVLRESPLWQEEGGGALGEQAFPKKGGKRQWHSEGPDKVGAESRQAAGRRHRPSPQLSYSPTAKVELRMGRTSWLWFYPMSPLILQLY